MDAACRCDVGGSDVPARVDTGSPDASGLDVDPSCATPQDARGEGGCEAELGVVWTGSFCASISGCSCVGADCDALYQTHEACAAAHPGCPRSCGGLTPFGSPSCLDSELCDYPVGSECGGDDGQGICRPRPTACDEPAGFAVCGCDGMDHPSECGANLAGTDVARLGECDTAYDEGRADGSCGLTGGHMWTFTFAQSVDACDQELSNRVEIRLFRELTADMPGDVTIALGGAGGDASICVIGACRGATGSITIHAFDPERGASVSYAVTDGAGGTFAVDDVRIDLVCSRPPSGCR